MKILLPSSNSLTNVQLNALEIWRHRRCSRCGRAYPMTLLNVLNVIEKGDSLQCVNRRSCDEFRKEVRG